MADVLLGRIGKVVDAAGCGKSRHGLDTHRVYNGLHSDLAQLHSGLLHSAGPAITDRLAQQPGVKHQPPPPQLQYRDPALDISKAQDAA